MKRSFILLLYLLGFQLQAQDVFILDHYTTIGVSSKPTEFLCVTDKVNVAGKIKVGRVRGYCSNKGRSSINYLYEELHKKANELGADAMKIDTIIVYSKDSVFVEGTLYLFGSVGLQLADDYYPVNKVYLLGDFDQKLGKSNKVHLNGVKFSLPPLGLLSYQNSIGMICMVTKGGFFGASLRIKGQPDKKPLYLAVGESSVGPAMVPAPGIGIGISYTPGQLFALDRGLGYFAVSILERLNVEVEEL